MFYFNDRHKKLKTPLFPCVSAGFPSPADDHIESSLDLNDYLINRPAATFLVRARGTSMTGAGIFDGDILVVDKSIKVEPGQIVIAALDGEFTVKRLLHGEGKNGWRLQPENPDFPCLDLSAENDFAVWGVVTGVVRRL